MSLRNGLEAMINGLASKCKVFHKLVAICLVLLTLNGNAAEIFGPDGESVAAVVDNYFLALKTGDTNGLMALMTADEAKQSESVLSEPGYASFLIDRYQGASLEVLSSLEKNGMYLVEVAIHLASDEVVSERLVLKPLDSGGYIEYRIFRRNPL